MSVQPIVAPGVPNYATETPYITVAEFLAEPTGVDVSQLIPAGSSLSNTAALARLIARASSQADDLCFKKLAATVDVEAGDYRLRSDGTIWVPVAYKPIVQVNAVSLGLYAGATAAMSDLSGLDVGEKLVKIPVTSASLPAVSGSIPRVPSRRGTIHAIVTYVNGYAVTTLSAAASANASSVSVRSSLGIVAGLPMTLSDDANTESVIVDASYVPGSLTVPTATPLQFAHGQGAALSALPGAIKDAVILLVASRIKMRGAEAVQMGAITSEPSKPQPTMPGGTSELAQAKELLRPFARAR